MDIKHVFLVYITT